MPRAYIDAVLDEFTSFSPESSNRIPELQCGDRRRAGSAVFQGVVTLDTQAITPETSRFFVTRQGRHSV
jgi:hypothetical protein